MTLTTQMNDIICNYDWETCYDCVVIRYIHCPVPMKFMELTTKCFVIDLKWMCCCQDKGLAEVKRWWLSSSCILWCWLFLLLWAWFSHCGGVQGTNLIFLQLLQYGLYLYFIMKKFKQKWCLLPVSVGRKYKSLPWGMLQQYQKLVKLDLHKITQW